MNDFKNIKNVGEAAAVQTGEPTGTPEVRPMSRPRAIIGCTAAVISLIAFLFLAFFQILALDAALAPPPAEGIDARRLGLAIGWLFSLICCAPQLLFGILSAICLRRAEKRTPLRAVRLVALLFLLLAILSTAALTGYILVTN